MNREINFYMKQDNGTVPITVKDSSQVIKQLLEKGIARIGFETYYYQDIRIQPKSISIFISPAGL